MADLLVLEPTLESWGLDSPCHLLQLPHLSFSEEANFKSQSFGQVENPQDV